MMGWALGMVVLMAPGWITPAWGHTQFNCRVASVPPSVFVTLDIYASAACQEKPVGPIDCLHFAIVSVGTEPGYVTFGYAATATAPVTAYFPLWGPSPGWFHAPQIPIATPGLNRVTFVHVGSYATSMRVLAIGMARGELGCQ